MANEVQLKVGKVGHIEAGGLEMLGHLVIKVLVFIYSAISWVHFGLTVQKLM